jgi:UDP-N-acetylmuramoyl-L-alanyl-D-glutamate--2,6-diaminopimelate ligase
MDDRGERGPGRPLRELITRLSVVDTAGAIDGVRVRGIQSNSDRLRAGELFVALRGTTADGHDFLEDAVDRGACGVVVESRPASDLGVPVLRVEDTRRALATLAASWYGNPAAGLRLIGITGTVGKTSVLAGLEAIMLQDDRRLGTIGSLGVHIEGETLAETGYTAPDPLLLHESLANLRSEGADLVAMEVTSHALDQERVHGLEYQLGIFTNLLPLEHQEYHGSFENYVAVKVRFLDHLQPGAPLVYNADDPAVQGVVEDRGLKGISCGSAEWARVRLKEATATPAGTRLTLSIAKPLPTLDGATVPPLELPLSVRLLGRSNVNNVALAATAALLLGTRPEAIQRAVALLPPARRRTEVLHDGDFTILDDTVGHPESVTALFEAVAALAPRRLHIAVAVRGMRGAEINARMAETLAIWAERVPPATLVVTRSEEAADERNQVSDEEYAAFTEALASGGVDFESCDRLDTAVRRVLDRAGAGDLVLLLGAQGMDAAADIVRDSLGQTAGR